MRTTITRKNGTTTVNFADSESGITRSMSTQDDSQAWATLRRWSIEADHITGRTA